MGRHGFVFPLEELEFARLRRQRDGRQDREKKKVFQV